MSFLDRKAGTTCMALKGWRNRGNEGLLESGQAEMKFAKSVNENNVEHALFINCNE